MEKWDIFSSHDYGKNFREVKENISQIRLKHGLVLPDIEFKTNVLYYNEFIYSLFKHAEKITLYYFLIETLPTIEVRLTSFYAEKSVNNWHYAFLCRTGFDFFTRDNLMG